MPRTSLRLCSLIASGVVLLGGLWQAPVSATVRPKPFVYDFYTLPNGLKVVLYEDHSTPIVNLQLWYHVGSKNERPGRTGFAHLFEHMMFKGSRNVVPEAHTSYIASIGGQSNAYTTEDTTVFWETVPQHYLPLILWLEADRMASLRVEESTFKTEREVVKEERRTRVENQPYGRLSEIIYDRAFTTHPYKHPVIGSIVDLEAASIDDVREFHRTYYRPDNATLVLAGDFDPALAKSMIEQYFGKIPTPATPLERNIAVEPPQTAEKRATITEDWPLPAVVVAHRITYDGHPDSYPLHIAAKVLSDGQSSRIYERLVYKERLALSAFGQANLIEDPNLFYTVAIVSPGRTPEQVAAALISELDRLANEPITARELQRTKNQFARDYVLQRQTIQSKATALAHAVVLHKGDITTADNEFDIFQNITAEDVQRVAKTYFKAENRLVLTIMPSGQRPTAGAVMTGWGTRAGWLLVVAALVSVTSPLCAQERPPRPLQAKDVKFPPYEIRTLDNGLRVVVVSQNEQPAVSLRLLVRAGSALDPADRAGLAAMVGALGDQGVPGRTSSEIAETIDYVGGALGTGAGTDLSFVNALVLKTHFDLALDLVSEVARTPTFPQEELDRVRDQALSAMQVNMQDPDYVADVAIDRLVYGFHPYGLPGNGTPASIQAITRADLVTFHETWFAPNNAFLAVVGDVTPEEAFAGVERAFGSWARKDVPAVDVGTMPEPTRRLVLIDRPGSVQTEIRAATVAIPRKHPDYMAVNLASKILGGEGANRLQNVLRSERGLTYGASADMDALKQGGAIVAKTDTQTSTTGEALRITVDEFARLVREQVGDRELMGAQAYLAGSFPLGLETADEIALQVLNVLFYDLDVKDLETYPARVSAVTAADVQRVAREFIKPDRLSIVLVGDAGQVLRQLERVGFTDVEVVPIADVDLTSATLRRRSTAAVR